MNKLRCFSKTAHKWSTVIVLKARRICSTKTCLHVRYGDIKIVLVRKNIYHKLNTSSKFRARHLETKHTHTNIWPQHSANAWETVLLRSMKTQLRLLFGSRCLVSGRALARPRFTVFTAYSWLVMCCHSHKSFSLNTHFCENAVNLQSLPQRKLRIYNTLFFLYSHGNDTNWVLKSRSMH